MPVPSLLESKLKSLKEEVEKFEDVMNPATFKQEVAKLQETLKSVRERGYKHEQELEKNVDKLYGILSERGSKLYQLMKDESQRLLGELKEATAMVSASAEKESFLARAEEEIADLQRKVSASKETMMNYLNPFDDDKRSLQSALYVIQQTLGLRDEASFSFNAGENVIIADKAEWVATGKGKDDPDGVVFLTDQRLCFEQKETTGKFLGMFGGDKQHGLKWEFALDQIASVTSENKGFLGNKDMVTIALKPGAAHSEIVLEIKSADNKVWVEKINSVIS